MKVLSLIEPYTTLIHASLTKIVKEDKEDTLGF